MLGGCLRRCSEEGKRSKVDGTYQQFKSGPSNLGRKLEGRLSAGEKRRQSVEGRKSEGENGRGESRGELQLRKLSRKSRMKGKVFAVESEVSRDLPRMETNNARLESRWQKIQAGRV